VATPPAGVLPLLTTRLSLRELREDDLDELYGVYAHPLVEPWIGGHTREEIAQEIGFHAAHQARHGWRQDLV
jgi:RimJ/RimL family protein N-acetyltransferase